MQIKSMDQLYEKLPEDQRLMLDVLRQIVRDNLPEYCGEKISYNVPYFFGNKGMVIIWPAAIPRGGIKKGVLFGFWYGNRLQDVDRYLTKGENKQVYYKIFRSVEEIDEKPLVKLIKEAVKLDAKFGKPKG
jgi:hypothetical protein